MVATHKTLFDSKMLSNNITGLYSVPDRKKAIIKNVIAFNTFSNPVTVCFFIVPPSGVSGVDNQVAEIFISGKQTENITSLIDATLEAGYQLQALCDMPQVVSVRASGIEIS